MTLKSLSLLCLVVLPLTAAAKEVGAKPQVAPIAGQLDPETLGRVDGMLTLCARADAENRATYQAYRAELIVFGEGTPQEMRAAGSDTPAYRDAHAATVKAAGAVSTKELARQCRQMIGASAGSGT